MSPKKFDGKNIIWPFITYKPEKNSTNRIKRIFLTKPNASVNKDTVKELVLMNLIPVIKRNYSINYSTFK